MVSTGTMSILVGRRFLPIPRGRMPCRMCIQICGGCRKTALCLLTDSGDVCAYVVIVPCCGKGCGTPALDFSGLLASLVLILRMVIVSH